MDLFKLIFICVALLLVLSNARECGLCLGESQFCGAGAAGECLAGTKCTRLDKGSSLICAPTVEPYAACSNYAYDPCPAKHVCHEDTATCELVPGTADINDGCKTDDDCSGLLVSCNNGICGSDQDCSISGCPIGQKCSTEDDPLNPVCVDKGRANSKCSFNSECYLSSCISGLCREWFSAVEGGDCNSGIDCEVGLECVVGPLAPELKCYAPNLKYIGINDIAKWGPSCNGEITGTGDGCICNPLSHQEQFLIEFNPVFKTECKEKRIAYYECIATNKCYAENTEENACMRKNCYDKYIASTQWCEYKGMNIPRCSASTFMYAIILLIALILLH